MTPRSQATTRPTDRWSMSPLGWLTMGALLVVLLLLARDVASRSVQQPVKPVEHVPSSGIAATMLADVVPVSPALEAPPADRRGLLGMDAGALRASLGAPDFVRRDGGAQMWRYGSGACTLTLFLHGQDGKLAVEHVEGRGLRSPTDPSADCAERLVGERRRADLPG